MALDGITIRCITKELREELLNGRINKVSQPEKDELQIVINREKEQKRLLISANASLPLIYLTNENKKSPLSAPNFCMLLRKHLQNGRIVDIYQVGMERIIHIVVEHYDELGDLCRKILVVEIMGKHSNIILLDSENMILDSIKHVSAMVSSVRQVLPGRDYLVPETKDKYNLYDNLIGKEEFVQLIFSKPMPAYKGIYTSFVGVSPVVAQEICYQSKVDGDKSGNALDDNELENLYHAFSSYMNLVIKGEFRPQIIYKNKEPLEFGVEPFSIYEGYDITTFDSVSEVLFEYYKQKSTITRIRQKSVDLRKIVQTALERNVKKYDIQKKQLEDTDKREEFRLYGELLNTYGYGLESGLKEVEVINYYTNEPITIPLDNSITPVENAQKYFKKYNKLKRTFEALSKFIEETKQEIEYLESVMSSLDIALQEEDLVEIKQELIETSYIKKRGNKRKEKITSKPFHFISKEGFHIYVGKNNYQNEELTFEFANGNDWWFHAKNMAGSHVIVKNGGKEMSDETFEDAGRLAAHFSKGRGVDKVEIDYIERKHVKKPSGGKPGFVVYYTNYSLMIDSDISNIEQCI